jgi:hypothetical protein
MARTALKAYAQHQLTVTATLERIKLLVGEYEKLVWRERRNWGHAGTMEHVAEQLLEVERSLNSAVENTRRG